MNYFTIFLYAAAAALAALSFIKERNKTMGEGSFRRAYSGRGPVSKAPEYRREGKEREDRAPC